MKYFGCIVALLILSKPILPMVDYWVNYEYIAKELCENKAKPEMHCDGKCHLKKELAKASEEDKPISSDKKATSKQESEVLFFESKTTLISNPILLFTSLKVKNKYQNLYVYLSTYTIFHPPSV